jgi:O-antigen ligase
MSQQFTPPETEVAGVARPFLRPPIKREPLAWLYAGLFLFLLVYFLRPEDWSPALESVPIGKIVGAFTLIALIFSLRDIRWHVPPEVIFLILLVAQMWLAVPFSPVWKWGALNYALGFTKVVPLIIVMYASIRNAKRLRRLLLLQAVCVAIVAIVSIINSHSSGGRLQGALSGIYENPNDLAFIIDLSLPLCLAFALSTKKLGNKIWWSLAMVVMVYTVLLTASRGGALALLVAAVVCVWRLGIRHRRFSLLLLVPAAIVGVWLGAGRSLEQRFEATDSRPTINPGEPNEAAASREQREALFIESLRVTAKYPLLGVGPGNFAIVSGVWRVTHNSYTQISSEAGIPALIFYVLILWRGVANLRFVRKQSGASREVRLYSMALEATLFAYLVGSFFASVAYQLFPYCIVAYTSSLRRIEHNKPSGTEAAPQPPGQQVEPPVEYVVWQ